MSQADAYARSRARIAHTCDVAHDTRALRLEVLDEVRRVVGFDAYAWVLTDPETSVGTAPLADVPWLSELPQQIRLKYLTPVNRWTTLDGSSVALLAQASGGDLGQSLLWRELLVRYDIGDVASVVFRDRFGCWAFLELWRSTSRERFQPAEAAFLADMVAPLTRALRTTQQSCFVAGQTPTMPLLGPVVLLLSPDLQVRGQTAETLDYLRVLVPPAEDRPPIPASAYNVAAQLIAAEAGVDSNSPRARVHLSSGQWVTVRAARLGDGPSSGRDIAVTLERSTPPERADLFSRVFALSTRESELLRNLVSGCDTAEVARRMYVSSNTVQDHLKAMFAKTSTRNRRTLLSRALGT